MGKNPAKLKVFEARFGFYDTVIAAPSQAAALRAWGSHQNLFAEGYAHVTTDEKAVEAALANPGTPLRRPVGSAGAFEEVPTGLPSIPDGPKKPARKSGPPTEVERPAPVADRGELDKAESELRTVDARWKTEEKALAEEQEALDKKGGEAQEAYVRARKSALNALEDARRAYQQKSGKL